MKIHGQGGRTGKNSKVQKARVDRETAKQKKIERNHQAKMRKINSKLQEAVAQTKQTISPLSVRALEIIAQWEKSRSKPKKLINIYKLAVDRWQHGKILEILRDKLKNVVREEEYNSVDLGCLKKEEKEKIITQLISAKPSQRQIDQLISQVEKYKKQIGRLTKR